MSWGRYIGSSSSVFAEQKRVINHYIDFKTNSGEDSRQQLGWFSFFPLELKINYVPSHNPFEEMWSFVSI
jgi:hypothetical protein